MATLSFASKAETLERLRPTLKSARLPEQFRFQAQAWLEDRSGIERQMAALPWLGLSNSIVRSSADAEDRAGQSLAGHFESVPDVSRDGLGVAVDRVIASYGSLPSAKDQVFIQPMVQAKLSGVIFTCDPNTGAPYIVINYADGENTAAVTGGQSEDSRTFVYRKGAAVPIPAHLEGPIALAGELERCFGQPNLDIEFAVDKAGLLYLLQVRPLVGVRESSVSPDEHHELLASIAENIAAANRPHPYLRGRRTLFGVMPDWNPAEIIGLRPRPLALSLYRDLVTDNVWAYQRHNYGYRNLRSFPLMRSFRGLPYIDVRLSFNSFVPSEVSDALADRLVDCYIDQLAEAPVLHDKVEFEIVHSCYAFDLADKLGRLRQRGFEERECDELSDALRNLTNRIIEQGAGLWRIDAERIEILEERQRIVRDSDMDRIGRLYWALEDCKRYGTLPFAGLARAGFIAIQMLKSLVAVGALEPAQYHSYLGSLETVSGRMARDLRRLSRAEFLSVYGHLRPGTYDILSARYDEAPDRYLGEASALQTPEPERGVFSLTLTQMRTIDALLRQHHLDIDVVRLFEFFDAGIQGREHAKFVFTKSLSDALSLLAEIGAERGIDRESMSFFDARNIADLYVSSSDVGALLRSSIALGRERYRETQAIVLPPLISSPDDVWAFHVPPTEPNFITQNVVEAPVVSHDADPEKLAGAIVAIPSADPGFDWLFSRGIRGLITAFGGVNSHMAIRAGELSLPAVIGAGEPLYNLWSKARRLRLDCAARRVDML